MAKSNQGQVRLSFQAYAKLFPKCFIKLARCDYIGEQKIVLPLPTVQVESQNQEEEDNKEQKSETDSERCGICNKKFASRWNVQIHLRIHTNDRPYKCGNCGKRFIQKAHVQKHITSVHNGKAFKSAESNENKTKNQKQSKNETEDVSSETFTKTQDQRKTRPKMQNPKPEKPNKQFPVNTAKNRNKLRQQKKSKILSYRDRRLQNIKKRNRKKLEQKSSKDKENVGTTTASTSNNNDKNRKCEKCNKIFSNKGNLDIHMRSHNNERPYVCLECGQRYKQCGHVQKHIKSSHPEADKSFYEIRHDQNQKLIERKSINKKKQIKKANATKQEIAEVKKPEKSIASPLSSLSVSKKRKEASG